MRLMQLAPLAVGRPCGITDRQQAPRLTRSVPFPTVRMLKTGPTSKAPDEMAQGYRIWSRTSFQRVVMGSGPAVQRWEGRLKGHIKLGHAYQEANLTRASSRER